MIPTNHPLDEYNEDLEEQVKIRRIIIELPTMMHSEIKSCAAARGITVKKYVMRAIIARIKKEREEES